MMAMQADRRFRCECRQGARNELEALREVLRQTLPHAQIEAKSVGENIILMGEVDSLLEAQRALDIASNLSASA